MARQSLDQNSRDMGESILSQSRFAFLKGEAREEKLRQIIGEVGNMTEDGFYEAMSNEERWVYHELMISSDVTATQRLAFVKKVLPNWIDISRQAYKRVRYKYTGKP